MATVNRKAQLKKFPGKGGWTYAEIPEIALNPENPFGWVTIKGRIDNYYLEQYKLMPMGGGKLFLPVKAEIRRKIKKEAGDWVQIELELDESPIKLPDELRECLINESKEHLARFLSLTGSQQKKYIDWIYAAKTNDTMVKRIVELMDKIADGPLSS